ncbi:MAG TPA: DUF6489 family protein [Caulobacteraceae bacterium]
MNLKMEIECTPQEARAFLGLPDVSALNDSLVAEMGERMKSNMAMLAPDELMKSWMSFGGQASEQFIKLMGAAASGVASGKRGK